MRAIGISGYAGSGKTTLANILVSDFGFERRHIATPLRAMLVPLLKAQGLDDLTIWAYLEGPLKEDVIPELGVTSRHLQITLGTEWGRDHVSKDIWSNTWARGVGPNDKIINDSVRFPNEQQAIRDLGGIVIAIKRPGVGPIKFKSALSELLYKTFGIMSGVHESERIDRIHADVVVVNEGSIADLRKTVHVMMKDFDILPESAFGRDAA